MILVVSENLNGYMVFDPITKRDCTDSFYEEHEENKE
jgi:hypothetical protein